MLYFLLCFLWKNKSCVFCKIIVALQLQKLCNNLLKQNFYENKYKDLDVPRRMCAAVNRVQKKMHRIADHIRKVVDIEDVEEVK